MIAVAWLLATNLLDGTFSLSESGEFGVDAPRVALLGVLLLAVGVTIAGFGLGNLIRNTPAAVTALLLWPLVLENILARLLFAALDLEWEKYLPVHARAHARDRRSRRRPAELMSRLGAGLYFFAWVDRHHRSRRHPHQRSDA